MMAVTCRDSESFSQLVRALFLGRASALASSGNSVCMQ